MQAKHTSVHMKMTEEIPNPPHLKKTDALSVNPEILANSEFDASKPCTGFFRYAGNMMDSSLNIRITTEMIWLASVLEHCS